MIYIITTNKFDGNINIQKFRSNKRAIVLENTNGFLLYDLHPINGNLIIFYSQFILFFEQPFEKLNKNITCYLY